MTTLHEKAEAEMVHEAKLYEWAYSHLSSQVGLQVMDELAASKKLEAAVKNVVGQRISKNLEIGDALNLEVLGLSQQQLAHAAAHRAERAQRLAAITPVRGDVLSETIQMRRDGHDVGGEGHGRPGFAAAVGGEQSPAARGVANSQSNGRVA